MSKLTDLKKIIKNPTLEDKKVFDEWEKRLQKGNLYRSWLDHPVTKDIALSVANSVSSVNRELLTDIDMKLEKRKRLMNKRDMWLDFLGLFNPDLDITKVVEQEIEEGIRKFKEYYNQ